MLRLESQQSGWAKAAFKVAAHHAVQYLTSGLVDTAFEYALSSAVAVNPIGLPVMTGRVGFGNPAIISTTSGAICILQYFDIACAILCESNRDEPERTGVRFNLHRISAWPSLNCTNESNFSKLS